MKKTHRYNHKAQQQERINQLTKCLSEAWTVGSNHMLPAFVQLNQWRETISRVYQPH